MPALLLQKSHSRSKVRDHISSFNRRLELWEKGNISELLKEGKLIQSHICSSFGGHPKDDNEKLAHTHLVEVDAALRLLATNECSC